MTDCSCKKASEPLIGVAEVRIETQPSCTEGAGVPCEIQVEKAGERIYQATLPKQTIASCLPWVRVERDPEAFRTCLANAVKFGPMDDPKNIFDLIGPYLTRQDQEVFLVVLLDTQLQVRGISEIVRGARDGVAVPVPDVLRIVLVDGAMSFVVVHNHPSGRNVQPSDSDKELTKSIAKAGKSVGVPLMDHVIVGVDKYFSFAEHKLLD